MDVLADILRQTGIKGRKLNRRSFVSASALKFPCEKSIGFHVVIEGTAFIHLAGKKQAIELKSGDIALMARGCHHSLSTESTPPKNLTASSDWNQPEAHLDANLVRKPKLIVASGAYQFWNDPVHPLFDELPEWFILKSDEMDRYSELRLALELLSSETVRPAQGTDTVIQALLDVLFCFILRKVISMKGSETATWSHSLKDPGLYKAIESMHSDYARDWTLESLAKKSGISRAGFASKFRKSMGETPLKYLTTVRMQAAANLLITTDQKLETVAASVGYQDPFSFSKAFKRATGSAPRDYRELDRKQRDNPWRF